MLATLRHFIFLGLCLAVFGISTGLHARQDSSDTEAEVKEMAQKQFERMYKKVIENTSDRMVLTGGVKPFAVVTDTGDKVTVVRLKQAEEMPAELALEVVRRSLRVLVGKGKVGATTLVYVADNPNKNSEAEKVLVAEMEHIFGLTFAQLTPYTMKDGEPRFGEPVVVEMKPSIFRTEGNTGEEADQ